MLRPRLITLQTQLAIILLLAILLPTALVAKLAYDHLADTIRQERIKTVGRVADARHEQLTMVFQRARNRAEGLLADLARRCGDPAQQAPCYQQGLEAFLGNETALGALLTINGHELKVGKSELAAPVSFTNGQLAQFSARDPNFYRVFHILAGDARGRKLTVVYPVSLIQPVFATHPDLGDSGETFLADSKGHFITSARYPSQQGHGDPISAKPMRRCLSPENGETLDLDYRDIPIIHGFRHVKEIGGGCIMAHIDQAEAFAPLEQLRSRVLAATLLFAAFAVVAAAWLARRISTPIRHLTQVARDLTEGAAVHATPGGYTETAELATAFNSMTERLAAINAGLEQRVRERTESLRLMSSVFQSSGEGICITDAENRIVAVNAAFSHLTGYTEAEVSGRNPRLLATGDTPREVYAQMWTDLLRTGYWQGEVYDRDKSGRRFPVRLAISTVRDANDNIANFFASFTDISRQKQAEQALRESEERWHFALEGAGDGVWDWNLENGRIVFSRRYLEMLGYAVDVSWDCLDDWKQHVMPDDLQQAMISLETYLDGKASGYVAEYRMRCADGDWKWMLARGQVVRRAADGRPLRLIGTHSDITERVRTQESLRLMATVFTNSGEAVLITDTANRIVRVNQSFTTLTGFTEAEVLGRDPKLLSAGRTSRETYQALWAGLAMLGHWEGELWDRRKSGEAYPKWISITLVRDHQGHVTHHIASFTDITERKGAEERILHLANHDPLTQLPNRLHLGQRLDQALAQARRNNLSLALMLIDLDRFKQINDTLGHAVGDQLLIEVAQRLRAAVREADIVARLGGDEFIVVVTDIDSRDDAAEVAAKLVAAISAPYAITAQGLSTSPSIGIAIYLADGDKAEALMNQADLAMYRAKNKGRGNYQFSPNHHDGIDD